ncbi:MAG: hypothetical protein ACRD2G_14825, partial [Terriglobia bacterium]
MKKSILHLCTALALGAALGAAKTPPKPADFSGTWVLDASQTKNLPPGLESYRMAVRQDPQQLKVDTSLKGDVKGGMSGVSPNGPSGPNDSGGPQGSDYPGGSRGGIHGSAGAGIGGMGRMGGMGMPGGE